MADPRLMIAGTGSTCGKTWITCALMRALSLRGMRVAAFKCGPDYIDPLFHEKVLGIPSRNLDLYFTDQDKMRDLFLLDHDRDISIVEGVMGLYDGLGGIREEASSYDLARALKMPILLVVNAHGKGRSLAAEINGFLQMDTEKLICGIILNRVSASFYGMLRPVLEELTGVKVLGYMPSCEEWKLESRHLGLKLPREKEMLLEHVTHAAAQMERSVQLDDLLEILRQADQKNPLISEKPQWLEKWDVKSTVRIGVAKDEAFCFYYRDNLRMLENAGAELVYFSPIRDAGLPKDLDGLLLGGGYPELWAKELAENVAMREQIKEQLGRGLPSLAECGGFLYLHENLKAEDGNAYIMVGALQGSGFYTGRSVRFGYAEFSSPHAEFVLRGHEFHYFDSENCGEDWQARKPVTGRNWKCMHMGEGHVWGFAHLYYPSAPDFPKWFVGCCEKYRKEKGER